MRSLSIQQPYPHAIISLGKPVENRDWRSSNHGLKYRGKFLIHAGKTFYDGVDDDEFFDMQLESGVSPDAMLKLINGPYAFVLRNARPLTFRPCRGMLGFFNIPADVMALVQEEL